MCPCVWMCHCIIILASHICNHIELLFMAVKVISVFITADHMHVHVYRVHVPLPSPAPVLTLMHVWLHHWLDGAWFTISLSADNWCFSSSGVFWGVLTACRQHECTDVALYVSVFRSFKRVHVNMSQHSWQGKGGGRKPPRVSTQRSGGCSTVVGRQGELTIWLEFT